MKRSTPDTKKEAIDLESFSHADLATLMTEASVIHDGELDDVVNIVLTESKGQRLLVCTEDKDGMGISYKKDMIRAVTGRDSDHEIWMENDYTKSFEENASANLKILGGIAGQTVRAFAESLRPTYEERGFVILVVTAPTFGIVDAIHEHLKFPPMLVFAYTGSYNLRYMYDLVALSQRRSGAAHIVDTSAFTVLGEGKAPGLEGLSGMATLFKGTEFWSDLEENKPERCHAIHNFIRRFNTELVRPGRLMVPEYVNDKANESAMVRLNAAYEQIDLDCPSHQLEAYLSLVLSPEYKSAIKDFKRKMAQNIDALETDAAICDLFIGALRHLMPSEIDFIYGTWEVGRFSKVNPNGPRLNAMSWKLRCTREGTDQRTIESAVAHIRWLIRFTLVAADVNRSPVFRINPSLVIMLNGPRGAGKDTVAGLLMERHFPVRGERLSVGDGVRLEYMKLNPGITFEDLTDRERKEDHRAGIIALAESWRQKHGIDCWAKRLPVVKWRGAVYIISDWRFLEEYRHFRNMEGVVVITVRVTASPEARRGRGIVYTPAVDDSKGESGLDGFSFDHVIKNDSQSREELAKTLSTIQWGPKEN